MKHILLAACAVAILSGCGSQGKQAAPTGNPFLSEYTTPFQVPPFDQIKMEHYKPAFLQGMEEQQKEIEELAAKPTGMDIYTSDVPDIDFGVQTAGKVLQGTSSISEEDEDALAIAMAFDQA